jgi:hypothetical protein
MSYDVKKLYGTWENLSNNNILRLDEDGDFKLTPLGGGPESEHPIMKALGNTRGAWGINGNKLRIRIDPRSIGLFSPLRLVLLLDTADSVISRLTGAINLHDDKITRLTDTELWLERSDGDAIKYRKKEINSDRSK